MADAAASAPIAPLRAPIVGLNGGKLSKQQKNGGGLAGAGKEYSKYLQVFCMTFALKGRHQTEWPSRRKGVEERFSGFSPSHPQYGIGAMMITSMIAETIMMVVMAMLGPGILWLQLIMQFAVGLLHLSAARLLAAGCWLLAGLLEKVASFDKTFMRHLWRCTC